MQNLLLLFAVYFLLTCEQHSTSKNISFSKQTVVDSIIRNIQPPAGYHRKTQAPGSFGEWLGNLRLKKDRTVYLFNGSRKANQDVQFAVIDISVGNKDLQQCADAVMRLRAEYFFSKGMDDSICFHDGNSTAISFSKWLKGERWKAKGDRLISYRISGSTTDRKKEFPNYLELVFSYCGTYSLSKELRQVDRLDKIKPGDVFIKGGFPGHAMIVVDVAENIRGEKVFMLAQSYTPAQDIHIVKNPASSFDTPWYPLSGQTEIETPEWVFQTSCLKTWN
jgi:Domain of unknown function (4846)